jgi:acetyltransferase-like isoleucine patch superfamily enzyme
VRKTQGTGLGPWNFRSIGEEVTFEHGVLVFHPERISIGSNVYVGHYTILKAYHKNDFVLGDGTWIGQQCFFHSAGGITIGRDVGIGPGVKILTSSHDLHSAHDTPIMKRPLLFAPVVIGDGCDIGVNAVVLPGVTLGKRVQVGASAVVTKSFPDDSIVYGVPAKPIGSAQ